MPVNDETGEGVRETPPMDRRAGNFVGFSGGHEGAATSGKTDPPFGNVSLHVSSGSCT